MSQLPLQMALALCPAAVVDGADAIAAALPWPIPPGSTVSDSSMLQSRCHPGVQICQPTLTHPTNRRSGIGCEKDAPHLA